MSDDKVTVRPLKFFRGWDENENFTPESKPFTVTKVRAAELKANGLVEIVGERKAGASETRVPEIRMLQHDDGRPNDEPKPESNSPTPGDGVVAPAGPLMRVENPESLIPATEGVVERTESAPAATARAKPAAAAPVSEDTAVAKEKPAPRGTTKVKSR